MIKWLFFDLGSTLIDESRCIEYRISELLKQDNAPTKEILEKRMKENAEMNRYPYKDTAKEFDLKTIKWPTHLEKIYSEVPYVLNILTKKYNLGIIANQSSGAEERLQEYGIKSFFDLVISSAEVGFSKPDPKIFLLALNNAECLPKESYMIGDRLDNDIEPASNLGMNTIWVRQGMFAYENPKIIECKPNFTVNNIYEILKILQIK